MFKETSTSTVTSEPEPPRGTEPFIAGLGGVFRNLRRGEVLFVEGGTDRGVFLIRSGRVKLSTSLPDGKLVTVHVAGAGSIIGLNAVIARCEHEVTAEAIEATSADFIRSDEVRRLFEHDAAFAVRVAEEMARRYRSAHALLCSLAKSDPVQIKLAVLIAGWRAETGGSRIANALTHQQIAEMLGTTRETITRSFRRLRESGILTLKGHMIEIHDIERLHALTTRCDVPHRLVDEASRNIYM